MARRGAYLCADFEDVLEGDARVCELVLQQHDDIMVVLLQLLPLRGLGPLSLTLLDICLELSNLLVDVGNVLFDDIREFLGKGDPQESDG